MAVFGVVALEERPERHPAQRRLTATIACLFAMIWVAVENPPSTAQAADIFDAARFDAAQRAGRTIVVGVHADWCPVCSIQKPIVSGLLTKPAFSNAVHFLVDYDRDKAFLKRFGVLRQSTIIVFKGPSETGRLIGETSANAIEAVLRSGL